MLRQLLSAWPLLTVAASTAWGDCDAVLSNVRDYSSTRWTYAAKDFSAFAEEFCQQDAQGTYRGTHSSRSSNTGLFGKLLSKLVQVFGGYQRNRQSSSGGEITQDYRQALCHHLATTSKSDLDGDFQEVLQNINDEVIRAWERCKHAQAMRGGASMILLPGTTRNDFLVEVTWWKKDGAPSPAVTRFNVPSGMNCTSSDMRPGHVMVSGSTEVVACSCTLPEAQGWVQVHFNSTSDRSAWFACKPRAPSLVTRRFASDLVEGLQPKARICVPPEYKMLGGGGEARWSKVGGFLTASYPTSATCWEARARWHGKEEKVKLVAYVVGLYDPEDRWETVIQQQTSTEAQHPQIEVFAPHGTVMTGGGAFVPQGGGWGNLLTNIRPNSHRSWFAAAKDHEYPSLTTLTGYVVAIKAKDGGVLPQMKLCQRESEEQKGGEPSVEIGCVGWTLAGGGAGVSWNPKRGSYMTLLTASGPTQFGTWRASSMAHLNPDVTSTVKGTVVGLRLPEVVV